MLALSSAIMDPSPDNAWSGCGPYTMRLYNGSAVISSQDYETPRALESALVKAHKCIQAGEATHVQVDGIPEREWKQWLL